MCLPVRTVFTMFVSLTGRRGNYSFVSGSDSEAGPSIKDLLVGLKLIRTRENYLMLL